MLPVVPIAGVPVAVRAEALAPFPVSGLFGHTTTAWFHAQAERDGSPDLLVRHSPTGQIPAIAVRGADRFWQVTEL